MSDIERLVELLKTFGIKQRKEFTWERGYCLVLYPMSQAVLLGSNCFSLNFWFEKTTGKFISISYGGLQNKGEIIDNPYLI